MATTIEKQKNTNGCLYFLIRFGAILAVLDILIWVLQLIFHKVFPATPVTQNLIPFQNNFLAFTDAFITSETNSSEFSNDIGPISRFIISGILVFLSTMVLGVVFAIVPFLRKLNEYLVLWIFLPLIFLAFIHATFLPNVLTTFDSTNRKLIITTFNWWVIPESVTIDYSGIKDFNYKLLEDWGGEHSYNIYASLFVEVKDRRIFIGDNEVGYHSDREKNWKLSNSKKTEIERAIGSLKELTGLKTN